jgi:hypothetical protein
MLQRKREAMQKTPPKNYNRKTFSGDNSTNFLTTAPI